MFPVCIDDKKDKQEEVGRPNDQSRMRGCHKQEYADAAPKKILKNRILVDTDKVKEHIREKSRAGDPAEILQVPCNITAA